MALDLPTATVISVPSAVVSFFANTLPIVQWTAGILAAVVAAIAIYKFIEERVIRYRNKDK